MTAPRRSDELGFRGACLLFLTVLKGMVVLAVLATLILLSGLLWDRLIGNLGGIMLGLETVGVVFFWSYVEEVGGLWGVVGRFSGWVHTHTCRDADACPLCAHA